MDREQKVNDSVLRRYRVMRLLYMGSRTYDELEAQMQDVPAKWLITALSRLLNNHDIRKERIEIELQQATTEVAIAKELLGVKEKVKYRYALTEAGKKKLTYFEWKYQLYTEVPVQSFPWSDEFNQKYYDEISERIRKNNWPTA